MPESYKRCRLSADEKRRIVKCAQQPHVQIAELCRRHGMGTILSYPWREEASQRATRAMSQPTSRKGQTETHTTAKWLMARPISPHAHRLRCPPHSGVAYCTPRPWRNAHS